MFIKFMIIPALSLEMVKTNSDKKRCVDILAPNKDKGFNGISIFRHLIKEMIAVWQFRL